MVGTARDGALLLSGEEDLDAAVSSGSLARLKLRNRWLYLAPDLSEEEVLSAAERAVTECLAEWLLGTKPYLSGAAAKRAVQPEISSAAMAVLINELCARGRIDGLALISQSYQPYLAFFAPGDRDEVEGQVERMRALLEQRGRVASADFAELGQPRPGRAWRHLILAHGEFLGLGYLSSRWEIHAW